MSGPLETLAKKWVDINPLNPDEALDNCQRHSNNILIWKQKAGRTELIVYRRSGYRSVRINKRFSAAHSLHGPAPFIVLAERASVWLDENPELVRGSPPTPRPSIRNTTANANNDVFPPTVVRTVIVPDMPPNNIRLNMTVNAPVER